MIYTGPNLWLAQNVREETNYGTIKSFNGRPIEGASISMKYVYMFIITIEVLTTADVAVLRTAAR